MLGRTLRNGSRNAAGNLAGLPSVCLLIWLASAPWSPAAFAAGPAGPGGEPAAEERLIEKETIVIRADRAWEEPGGSQVMHFAGHFELISPEWELRSEEADLYGPLDDPDRIVARGAPALLTIIDAPETISGEGATIEYRREEDILILTGNAHLGGEDISLKSTEIVYDVGAERLRSSGSGGVEMVLERAK
ncbi:MAG TPA: LptA/OstA family protein [Pseudomonadales bacterium]